MKKILMFFITCGIIVGLIIGLKSQPQVNEEKNIQNETIQVSTKDASEINLSISDIDTLNPLRTKNSHIADILKLIYDPLISYDYEHQIEACLAKEWAKKDELTWIIKLRENVLWHGGEKFTSEDVKYTIETLMKNEILSPYASNVVNIKAVDIVDDVTIVLTLNEKDPYIMAKLTFPIIPRYYFKNEGIVDEEKSNRPVGTGAYKYFENTDEKLTLVANEEWWQDVEIRLKKINLKKYTTYGEAVKAFKSSEVDMIMTTMYNWKEKFGFIGINSFGFESSKYEVIIPNAQNKILKEPAVRRAILQAINRENIVSDIYDESASIQDIPIASVSKYQTKSTEYDLEKSKQTLINAGWTQTTSGWSKENKKLKFTLIVPENDVEKIAVAEKIKEDLNEISINITIKKLSWDSFKKAIESDAFELALATLEIKNEYQIQDMVATENIYNYANYTNLEMDKTIENLKKYESEEYAREFEVFKQIYESQMPYIGLYFKENTILTNKSVKGEYKSTNYNPYRNIINFCK